MDVQSVSDTIEKRATNETESFEKSKPVTPETSYQRCNLKKVDEIDDKSSDNSITNSHSQNIFHILNKTSTLPDKNDVNDCINKDSNDCENKTNVLVNSPRNQNRGRLKNKKSKICIGEQIGLQVQSCDKNNKNIYKCQSSPDCPEENYLLAVSNLPKSWTLVDIKKFIETQSGCAIDEGVMENSELFIKVQLTFHSYSECKQVMDSLYDKEVEGRKLCVELKDKFNTDLSQSTDLPKTKDPTAANVSLPWRPDLDFWEIDPEGLYGLKREFLKSLGVEPPIDKWVQVTNFGCDKSELRDILEMAGQVLMCTVMTINVQKCAKVMYSHPLEAVQAVSMLNGQTFYGQTLKLKIDRCPSETTILPQGLASIGLGFGKKGKPLRNIVKHYKRYVNNDRSSINTLLFSDADDIRTCVHFRRVDNKLKAKTSKEVTEYGSKTITTKNVAELFNDQKEVINDDINKSNATITVNTEKKLPDIDPTISNTFPLNQNVTQIRDTTNTPGFINLQTTKADLSTPPVVFPWSSMTIVDSNLQTTKVDLSTPPGILPWSSMPIVDPNLLWSSSPWATPPVPFRPGLSLVGLNAAHRPAQVTTNSGIIVSGQRDAVRPNIRLVGLRAGPVAVQLSHLPMSTTFPLLYEKLSVCGQITSLEFTTPGCAIARFSNPAHAEICIKQFNGLNAEGHFISASYM